MGLSLTGLGNRDHQIHGIQIAFQLAKATLTFSGHSQL